MTLLLCLGLVCSCTEWVLLSRPVSPSLSAEEQRLRVMNLTASSVILWRGTVTIWLSSYIFSLRKHLQMAKQLFCPSESIDHCSLTQASLSYNIWGSAFLKAVLPGLFWWIVWGSFMVDPGIDKQWDLHCFDTCLLLASSVTLFLCCFSHFLAQPGTLYLGLTVYSGSSGAFSGLPGSNKN